MLLRPISLSLLLLFALQQPARADGLADLKAALPKLSSAQPIKARVSVQTVQKQGEGKEATTDQGAASLNVEDDAQGLRLSYAPELLAKLQAEERAADHDAKAPSPVGSALGQLGLRNVRRMTSAAESLARRLAQATLKQETATTWQGQPARLLSFELAVPPDKDGYVKEALSTLQVWIAADGTPLESQSQTKTKGRAMVVISFEFQTSEKAVYARWGDRLVAVSLESQGGGSGGGKKGSSTTTYTLQR